MFDAVISGIGMVTPLGTDAPTSWDLLVRGERALRPRELRAGEGFVVGELPPLDVRSLARNRTARRLMMPSSEAALQAMAEALQAARLEHSTLSNTALGVFIASGADSAATGGQLEVLLNAEGERGKDPSYGELFEMMSHANPLDIIRYNASMLTAHLAIALGIDSLPWILGPAGSFTAAPLLAAAAAVSAGEIEVALVGGGDCVTTAGSLQFLLSRGCEVPASLADLSRQNAIVPSSGAAFLVIERLERCQRRGVDARVGLRAGAVATTQGDGPSGFAEALRSTLEQCPGLALRRAFMHADSLSGRGLAPDEEAAHALGLQGMASASSRPGVGHLLAAASTCDTAFSALALIHQRLPPLPTEWKEHFWCTRPENVDESPAPFDHAIVCNSWDARLGSALVLERLHSERS